MARVRWSRLKNLFDNPINIIVLAVAIIIIGLIIGGIKSIWLSPEQVKDDNKNKAKAYALIYASFDQDNTGKMLPNDFTDKPLPLTDNTLLKLDKTDTQISIPRLEGKINFLINQ